ncbi:hypothetical protein [Thiosulfatihalobacter marinus]|uniref:hypothetical protein n=1 Tax=Thiosulfatihalobacter marinus TaxID=2792481 RepID=UPI0018D7678D|nr:hypothetical protein [Thiosulfatihalobacter marinus]
MARRWFTDWQNNWNSEDIVYDPDGTGGSGTKGSGTKGSGSGGSGSKGSGTKGSGSKGSGTKGSGTKGSGTKGSGTKGSGTKGSGTKGSGSRGSGTKGSGSKGSGTRDNGSGKSDSCGSGRDSASSTKSYHNGGVEGDSFAVWYDAQLATEFDAADEPETITVLDLSDAGAAFTINVGQNPDTGLWGGSVEFRDENGDRVAWGHFSDVNEIRLPEDPTSPTYTIEDLDVIDMEGHGPGLPPKVSLDQYLTTETVEDPDDDGGDDDCDGTGTEGSGTKGSGTKGSGSKESGTNGSGSKGSGSKESGTSGSGSKGSGSKESGTNGSGSKGSGSKESGTNGSGSKGSGTKGSGSSGSGTSGSTSKAVAAGLPEFVPSPEDQEYVTLDDVMALMTNNVDENASGGTSSGTGDAEDDLIQMI